MFSCLFTQLPNPFFPSSNPLGAQGMFPDTWSAERFYNLGCFKGTVQSKSTITFENAPQMCDVLVFMAFLAWECG